MQNIMKVDTTKSLPYISVKACAEELGCSYRHVKNMIAEYGIKLRYFGNRPLINKQELIDAIEGNLV